MKHLIAILAMLALPVWGQNALTLGDGSRLTLNGAGYRLSVGAAASPYWTMTNSTIGDWEMELTNTTQILDGSAFNYNMSNMPSVAAGPARIEYTNQYGRLEHTYYFDGASQYFRSPTYFDEIKKATNMTISAWIKPQTTTRGDWVSIWEQAGYHKFLITFGLTASKYQFYWVDTATRNIVASNASPTNVWTMITVTYRSGGSVILYTNAVREYVGSGGVIVTNVTTPFMLGRNNNNSGPSYAKGEIDGVIVLDYATDDTTISNWYLNTHPTNNLRYRP